MEHLRRTTTCFAAIQCLGLATAIAVLASTGMWTSFLWGLIKFGEPVSSIFVAALAIGVLMLGSSLCSIANTELPLRWWRKSNKSSSAMPQRPVKMQRATMRIMAVGLGCAVVGGFLDGSLMVPYKLFQISSAFAGCSTFAYLAVFGRALIGVFMAMFLIQGIVWRLRTGSLQRFFVAARALALPGATSGALWAAANVCSVHASEYLGVALGFPLTQTNIGINAMLGILLFNEMPHKPQRALCGTAIIVILLGALLLARAGSV